MITKKQLLSSLDQEISTVKHLVKKLDEPRLDYRPAENMRSTLELARYLTICGIACAKALVAKDWDIARESVVSSNALSFSDILPALDEQSKELHLLIDSISEERLQNDEVSYPWGGTDKLGAALVNTSLKFLTAYKLQLFVYAKASGLAELNTMNAWMGKDPE